MALMSSDAVVTPESFRAALEELAPATDGFVLAVSGGGDSVAALRLAAASGVRAVVAHYDHGLRPDSEDDAAFVERLAREFALPFVLGGTDVKAVAARRGWNLEDAARRLRYEFLHRELKERKLGGIVVAHTLDDLAETVLLQLLRGTAFPVGLRARRGAVLRPLLRVRGAELRAYLEELGQDWREDATNADTSLNRAWLRRELLPQLSDRYGDVAERFASLASSQQEARDAIEGVAERRFGVGDLRVAGWLRASTAVRRTALAERLRVAGVQPTAELLERVEGLARATVGEAGGRSPGPARMDVAGGSVVVAYGELRVRGSGEAATGPREQERVASPAGLPPGVSGAVLEGGREVVLRRRASGDRIALPGGTKLVSDLLVDLKVPREERDTLAVLAAGREVFWVEGVAVAVGAAGGDGPPLLVEDQSFMRLALREAEAAGAAGEVPVGAVVVSREGAVLAAAGNRTERDAGPLAHAELLAMREASGQLGDWRLPGATLFVTLEPCLMCAGAILRTQLARVVYGADNLRDGAFGGVMDVREGKWKRVPQVRGGLLAGRATGLLRGAFAEVRRLS